MFHSILKFFSLALLLFCMVYLPFPQGSFATNDIRKGENWEIPRSLLQFDEKDYNQDVSSYHSSTLTPAENYSWALLGKQESHAHLSLGIFYHQTKRYDLAESEYKRSLDLDPEDPHTHFNLGIIYFDQKKLDLASEEYRKALELDPTFGIAHNNLGTLHLVKKEYGPAENQFKEALKLNPNDIKARVNLGHIYFYVEKKYLDAQKQYEKALALNPSISLVQTNLESIRKEQELARNRELKFESSLKQPDAPETIAVETMEMPAIEESPEKEATSNLFNF